MHIETRTNTWPFNWKLVLDTFTESYHVRTLHKGTLAPTFDSNAQIFEPFGHHLLGIGLRKDVVDEVRKPKEEWSLLPYGTMQYFIVPGALVVHQIDHIEVWRLQPIDVRTTTTLTSIYAPTEPHSERSRNYFVKNLEFLLEVTGAEDFGLMAKIQKNLDAGAMRHVVYGRNEPALAHLHRSIDSGARRAAGARARGGDVMSDSRAGWRSSPGRPGARARPTPVCSPPTVPRSCSRMC